MENTTNFLFDDVEEKYFLAVRGRAIGPLTAKEIYERIQNGEAGLLHYAWQEGWADWKRLYDVREFSVLVPQKPSVSSIDSIRAKLEKRPAGKKAPKPPKEAAAPEADSDAKNLYLYFNRSQYGPFSKKELSHVVLSQKIDQSAYLWSPGWANWKPISEMPEYATLLGSETPPSPPAPEAPSGKVGGKKARKAANVIEPSMGVGLGTEAGIDASERREAPRRPLVARLFLHNDKDVIIAICRDISVGGMQVLTDRIPGRAGSKIKLNVSPGDSQKVSGFVAEGEIVRVLEDGRGFSFRFTKISADARVMIEQYIKEGI